MSTATKTANPPAQSAALEFPTHSLDVSYAPERAKNQIDEFLNQTRDVGHRAHDADPSSTDALETRASALGEMANNIQGMLEKGNFDAARSTLDAASTLVSQTEQDIAALATTRNNPMGIEETAPSSSRIATTFTLHIPHGSALALSYKRRAEDGSLAQSTEPYKMAGDVSRSQHGVLGTIVRHPDPNNPGMDIITMAPPKSFRGFITVENGGRRSFLNVQNQHDNSHLAASDAPSIPLNTQALKEAISEIEKAKPKPSMDRNLEAGATVNFKDPGGELAFKYNGSEMKLAEKLGRIEIDGVTIERKEVEGNKRIFISTKPELDAVNFSLETSDKAATFHVKRPERTKLPSDPITFTPDISQFSLPVDRNDLVSITHPLTKNSITLEPGKEEAQQFGLTLQRGKAGEHSLTISVDPATAAAGWYALTAQRGKDEKVKSWSFEVQK